MTESLFPRSLRQLRHEQGLSQLQLAAAANISSKHLSFLETGRSKPSTEMVQRICRTLRLQLREQNALLLSAGFAPIFADSPTHSLPLEITRALSWMMKHHEPFPLMVLDHHYNLLQSNQCAQLLVGLLLKEAGSAPPARDADSTSIPINTLELLFHPHLVRPLILNWEEMARNLLLRLQHDLLKRKGDEKLKALIQRLCSYEGVPRDWSTPLLGKPTAPTLLFQFRLAEREFGFLTTLTVFQEPQNVAVEELKIESYYPADEATEELCRSLVQGSQEDVHSLQNNE